MQAIENLARRTKGFLRQLHEDESGPNTVEWILLVVVALVVLIGIYMIVDWSAEEVEGKGGDMTGKQDAAKDKMDKLNPGN